MVVEVESETKWGNVSRRKGHIYVSKAAHGGGEHRCDGSALNWAHLPMDMAVILPKKSPEISCRPSVLKTLAPLRYFYGAYRECDVTSTLPPSRD